jgi:ankyrin repeat protein
MLTQAGAEVDVRDDRERTPLHLASQSGHASTAQLLLEDGADMYAADDHNWSALHYAAKGHRLAVIRLLVQLDGDANFLVHSDNTKGQVPRDLCTTDRCRSALNCMVLTAHYIADVLFSVDMIERH